MSTMLNSNAIKNGSISKEKLTEALQQEVSKKLKGKVAPDAYGLGYGFYSPHKFNINSVFNIQKDGDGNIVSFTVGSVERINVYVVHMGYSEYQFDEFIQCQEGVIYWQWENEAKSFKFIKDNIPYDYGFDWGYTFTLTHPSEAQFHDVNDILRFLNDDECLIITEYWPHKPLDDLFIPGTIARRSELSKVATSGSYDDLSNKPTIPAAVTESTVSNWGFTKNQGTITDVKVNGTSVATSGVAEINIKASDLGVTGALKYCGITTTQLTDGATTNPVVIDGENHTAEAGCVVFYEDNGNTKEFVFNGSKWELLGSDLTYKVVQDKVSSPSANGTAVSFIDTISQDANGVITATKKNVDMPIIKGDVDNSAVLKGEYEGYSNKAISQVSTAIGAAVTAGLKGWYYTHVDVTNKKIYLSDKQYGYTYGGKTVACISNANKTADTSFKSGYEVGDIISLVYGSKYEDYATIEKVNGNEITLDKIPFSSDDFNALKINIALSDFTNIFVAPDDYSVYCIKRQFDDTTKELTVSKYNVGGVDFGGGALSEGVQTYAVNIGAHAEGAQTVAKGQYSHAEGIRTQANYAAHAEGNQTIASGSESHAEGKETNAIGIRAHAEGYKTYATATNAHAEGNQTYATATNAHAEGLETIADGNASHAEGANTTAKGSYSHAEGNLNYIIGSRSHAEGENNYVGDTDRDTPATTNTTAKGFAAHAEGQANTVLGNSAHAEGSSNKVTGSAAHVEGENNNAAGSASHAEGRNNTVKSSRGHVEGENNYVGDTDRDTPATTNTSNKGFAAHAEGQANTALGNSSHAEGVGTKTTNLAEHAEGKYNVSNSGKTIHSVGIGSSSARKNAHEITNDGKHYVLNVGNYDGRTLSGATDLAAVINNKANKSDLDNISFDSTKLTVDLTGDVTGTANFNSNSVATISTTVNDNSHYHNGSTITGGTTGDVLISNGWSSSWRKIEDTDIIFSETESLYAKVSPIDMAISPLHSANRIEFANPDGITIEYSRDGGNTWIDYGAANSDKVALCSTIGCDFRTGGVTTGTTTSYQLRVILNARDMGCYTQVTKMLVNISTDGTNGTKLKVEQSTIGAPNTYISLGEYQIGGWSGWNSIPLKKMGTFGGWDTNQNFNTRLTFSFSSYDNGYNGASLIVRNILLFGETGWSTPSEMARTGHLYSYDVYQNATFPSNVNVRGNLTVNNGRQIQEVALSGSYNDLSNTPTFKTINNQSIVGNGNIQINANFEIATNSEIDALFDNSSSNQGSY